jgi:hypothetical protein
MHGQNDPHLGATVVRKVHCAEAEPVRELAELRQEQEGEAKLGGGGNGAAVARLRCCCYEAVEMRRVGRQSVTQRVLESEVRLRGPPGRQVPVGAVCLKGRDGGLEEGE